MNPSSVPGNLPGSLISTIKTAPVSSMKTFRPLSNYLGLKERQQRRKLKPRRLFLPRITACFLGLVFLSFTTWASQLRFARDRLLQLVSASIRTKRTAAICCIVRDEEAYLREWIDYHLSLGFDHIYIYDNSNDFDLNGWQHEKTTIKHFKGQGVQPEAYFDCVHRYILPNRHRWIAFFDVDEFLALFQHKDVVDFLAEYCPKGAISINWRPMSWSNHSMYSPLPVTKRFQYAAHDDFGNDVHDHVKSITFLPDMDTSQAPLAHFAHLKPKRWRLDTSGERIPDWEWRNPRRPSDVALLYHFHTKSWKEYIAKRMRGRAGTKNMSSIPVLIDNALKGIGLRDPVSLDDTIWKRLTEGCPQYRMFEQDLGVATNRAIVTGESSNNSIAICAKLKGNDEFYIDEWVDYHLALGFSHIFLYDFSDEGWFKQWEQQNRKGRRKHVSVVSFHDRATNATFIEDCLEKCRFQFHKSKQTTLIHLDINEMLILQKDSTLLDMTRRDAKNQSCPDLIPIVRFGSSGRRIYEPLPVTKRFLLRIDEEATFLKPLITTKKSKNTKINRLGNQWPSKYLRTVAWDSDWGCSSKSIQEAPAAVYQYLRSRKECNLALDDDNDSFGTRCMLQGMIHDNTAWFHMKLNLPAYTGYDSFDRSDSQPYQTAFKSL